MESPGDEDDWRYAHDFARDDSWYTHTSTPLTFIRRRSHKRRLLFSLVAYKEWQMEPAQARNRATDEQFNELHENWNLLVPPSASLFVGTTSLYLDATFATLGIEEERERVVPVEPTHVTNTATDTDTGGGGSGGGAGGGGGVSGGATYAATGGANDAAIGTGWGGGGGGGGGDAMAATIVSDIASPVEHGSPHSADLNNNNTSNPHSDPKPDRTSVTAATTAASTTTTSAAATATTAAAATATAATPSTSTNNHVAPVPIAQLVTDDDDINMCSLRTIDIEL